jgi:hypothetical protein
MVVSGDDILENVDFWPSRQRWRRCVVFERARFEGLFI